MDFDLRLLRHARALADEGNFARAARAQHLTQPALSRSIQELERRTGLKLFDRGKSRVEPTDLGRIFLAHAADLLARAEALDRELSTLRGVGTGALAVGSGVYPTAIFMTDAVARFAAKHPGVSVRLVNEPWTMLIAALRRRELDFVVSAIPPADQLAGLTANPLSPRLGRFLVRPSHPLAHAASGLSLADITAHPIVSSGRLPAWIVETLAKARDRKAAGRSIPDLACESHDMMCDVAAATDHVVMTTLSAAVRWIERGALVPLVSSGVEIVVPFGILEVEGRTLPPIADELIREVVDADRRAQELDRALAARTSFPAPPSVQPPRPRRTKVASAR